MDDSPTVTNDPQVESVLELVRLYDPMGRPRLPKDQWAIVNIDADITINIDGQSLDADAERPT